MGSAYLLHHLLEQTEGAPGSIAIVEDEKSGDRSVTYAELRARVEAFASHLRACGVRRGDRVAILLPKCIEKCVAMFAASLAGGVLVPVNTVLRATQVRHILSDCGARAVVLSQTELEQFAEAFKGLPGLELIVIDAGSQAGGPPPPPCESIGEDLAAILYTSGSTGLAKGVMLSHRNLLAGTRIVRTYLDITGDDRILSILPFSFDYGLNQLLTSVEQGATIVLFHFKMGDEIVRALVKHRITGLAGVPTVWAILTKAAPSLSRTPLPDLRYITNSGGAVPAATVARLRKLLPSTEIFLMYGLTEAFRSTFLPPSEVDRRPTSIGKAIPECEVFPVTEDGRRAAPGEHGILVHRGPTVSMGYWNRPEDTARVLRRNPFRGPDEGGEAVCYSGDLVYEDEEGFLYFVGRNDAMIKSLGFRISPTEVEEVLMATGRFHQVAAIGVPDEWMGNKLLAVAVPLTAEMDVAAALRTAADQLPAHMIPGRIELVDSLPVTANGKIDYKRLVAERS